MQVGFAQHAHPANTGLTKLVKSNIVLLFVQNLAQPFLQALAVGRAQLAFKDAVLHTLTVAFEDPHDFGAPLVVRYIVGDKHPVAAIALGGRDGIG